MFIKKVISLLLTALMAFSVVTVGAVSASAVEEDTAPAITAGSHIFFDNTNTQWTDVYFYAWNYGYFGDSVPMEKVGDTNIYKIVVPQDVPNGAEYFLFKSAEDWSGQQTANQTVETGKNTYTPAFDTTGAMTVTKSFREDPATTEVAITPYSKSFTGSIDVTVYAFNTGDTTATYQIGDAEPVAFTVPTTINLTDTATVTVTAGTATTSCTFTKIQDAVITVDAGDYEGDMYIYTYGGDRVAPGFDQMVYNEEDFTYTYILNGSANVIFTTTNDWSTATKFLINGIQQEPFVAAGSTPVFTLTLPTA